MPLLAEDAGGASNSAVYMLIRNQGGEDDRLVGGESPASLRLEVHESRMENDVMRMRMLDGIDLPARGSVELAPGGLHLMLVGLTQALQEGDSVAVTLRFEKTGPMKVMVPIRLMGQR